ncbi:MAG TPA: glycosyltransferase family A protein [Tepidisphaeraceae bacterium]|nr:glycosyltransferase family A protein [Tepidisphaeraceae bacterium]
MSVAAQTETPRVSVVIPTVRRREWLSEAIASLQAQTVSDWEAIVVHDRAQVGGGLPQPLALSAEDRRVREFLGPLDRAGAPACRNEGVRQSVAPYVVFLDDDDLLKPRCLERRIAKLDETPELDMVVAQSEVFSIVPGDEQLFWNEFRIERDLDRFLRGDPAWQTAGPMWRRAFLERLGPWDEGALSWQDWEYHTRALSLGCKYTRLNDADCYYRRPGATSISFKSDSPDRVANRLAVIMRVRRFLSNAGQLTSVRNRDLTGVVCHLLMPETVTGRLELQARSNLIASAMGFSLITDRVAALLYLYLRFRALRATFAARSVRFVVQQLSGPSIPLASGQHLRATRVCSPFKNCR